MTPYRRCGVPLPNYARTVKNAETIGSWSCREIRRPRAFALLFVVLALGSRDDLILRVEDHGLAVQ